MKNKSEERKEIKLNNGIELYSTVPEDFEENQEYVDIFNKCLEAKDIDNIAITADFGVGKSSVLKRICQNLNSRRIKHATISLMCLCDEDIERKDNISEEETKKKATLLKKGDVLEGSNEK